MLRRALWWLPVALVVVGCATPPVRPHVDFYVHPEPMLIPQAPVPHPTGTWRRLLPPPTAVPICITDDHYMALDTYLDAIDAYLKQARP